jgi:CelD/BcsL family acetyltransferase involved in cellulose biosynthesis
MKQTTAAVRLVPPDAAAWDDLVAACPEATVFHTSAWARVWTAEWKDARWEAMVVADGNTYAGGIGAIARRRGHYETVDTMPFATYGGPIVRRDHADRASVRRLLLDAFARRVGRRLTVRSQMAWYAGTREEIPESLPVEEAVTHVLALDADFARLASGFSPSTRRLVRQAEESGLTMRVAESVGDIRAFYEIATETVRRRGGAPKPLSLYEEIFEKLVPAGLARFHLVLHDEEPVAASLDLFHQGIATSWLPVSRESSWNLRPNNFLVARLLATLCEAGYLEYNFGASPPDAAGLVRYKEGWGARPRPVLIAGRRSALHRRMRP